MLKRSFISKSYKNKLRLTYTLLMFVILIMISIFTYFQLNMSMKPIIGGMDNHVLSSQVQYLGEKFEDQNKLLELLSNAGPLKTGDISTVKKVIDNQMDKYKETVVSIKYKSITGEEYENKLRNIKEFDSYEEELLKGDSKKLISPAIFDDKSDEYVIFIGRKVIDDDGKTKGIITIKSSINDIFTSLGKTKLGQLNKAWIFDSNGDLVVRANGEEVQDPVFNIEELPSESKDNEIIEIRPMETKDKNNNWVYAKIPNTENLYFVTRIQENKEFKEATQFLLLIFLCGAAVISVFIFIAANKMTNFISNPLTRMVDIIENSYGVDFIEIPNDLKESKDEIGVLANTIDKMAKNIRNNLQELNGEIKERKKAEEHLKVLNDELECRVQDRTKELTKVTNNLAISENRFRIAMEASHIGVYSVDLTKNIFIVNSMFLKLINAPEYGVCLIENRDWIQCDGIFHKYIYEEDLDESKQLKIDNLPKVGEDFYWEFRLREDPNVWLSFSGQSLAEECEENGKITRFVGVLQNISEMKKSEAELKAAKEEAEEASLAKSQFLANMSHEIRTPMNAIIGLTHLIGQSDLNESQKNYLSKIKGSSQTLLRIINDILDFSKIEAGKLEVENIKFALDKVFENVSTLYTASAANKGIDLNFDIGEGIPGELKGDPLRLEQIITNLTTNAIKFTSHGEVNVVVRVEEEQEDKVKLHFEVSDTGIGLTKQQIEKLFKAFNQADNSMTRRYGGTGLGLAISKQLIDLMKGEIWVESDYGAGSAFHFTIEFEKVSNIIVPSYESYPELQGKKVLVIDHNKTSLMILKRMLKSFLLEVTALRDPFEAIDLLKREEFDLLFIDFNLPELSGIDLYKRLVVNTEIQVPKTIFVSSTGRDNYYNQANQLGVKHFLVKPINQSLMFETIIDALKASKTKDFSKKVMEESNVKFKNMLKDKSILLVEDNDINQLVAKDILEQANIKVSIANNGEEAIKYVHANKFDAVLMDVQMPIMDGYLATEILRESYSSTELPIIAMTANALKGDRERSIEAGMNDYVSKPIDPEILFETLAKWIIKGNNSLESNKKLLEKPINEQLEILDFDKTLTRLGGKESFYFDLLNKYLENYNDLISEFSDMRKNGKYEDAKRFIHSLKGVTGNIGAMKINKFIIDFEKAYEDYNEETLKEKLVVFSILNEELLNKIREVIAKKDSKEEEVNLSFDIYDALVKLLEALQKARAKEIKERMNYLATNNTDIKFSSKVSEIKKLVERYRFKEAKLIAEDMIKEVKE